MYNPFPGNTAIPAHYLHNFQFDTLMLGSFFLTTVFLLLLPLHGAAPATLFDAEDRENICLFQRGFKAVLCLGIFPAEVFHTAFQHFHGNLF